MLRGKHFTLQHQLHENPTHALFTMFIKRRLLLVPLCGCLSDFTHVTWESKIDINIISACICQLEVLASYLDSYLYTQGRNKSDNVYVQDNSGHVEGMSQLRKHIPG